MDKLKHIAAAGLLLSFVGEAQPLGVGSAINTVDRFCLADALLAQSPEELAACMRRAVKMQKSLEALGCTGAALSGILSLWFMSAVKKTSCMSWEDRQRMGRVGRSAKVMPAAEGSQVKSPRKINVTPRESQRVQADYVEVKTGQKYLLGRNKARLVSGGLLAAACIYSIVTAVSADKRKNRYQAYVQCAERIVARLQDKVFCGQFGAPDWATIMRSMKKAEVVGIATQMSTTFVALLALCKSLALKTKSKNIMKKDLAVLGSLAGALFTGYGLKPIIAHGMRATAGVPDIDKVLAAAALP